MMADDNVWRMLRFMNLMGLFFFFVWYVNKQHYAVWLNETAVMVYRKKNICIE